MLDQTTIAVTLGQHYDLAPSLEEAERLSGLYATMSRVVSPADWAIHAPYVEAINRLRKYLPRSTEPTARKCLGYRTPAEVFEAKPVDIRNRLT